MVTHGESYKYAKYYWEKLNKFLPALDIIELGRCNETP